MIFAAAMGTNYPLIIYILSILFYNFPRREKLYRNLVNSILLFLYDYDTKITVLGNTLGIHLIINMKQKYHPLSGWVAFVSQIIVIISQPN